MVELQQIFEAAAGADADAVLSTPNLAYVVELLRRSGEVLCVDDLEQIYAQEGWCTERSFSWLELQNLRDRLKPVGPAEASAASMGDAGTEDPLQFHAVPPDDLECEDATEEAKLIKQHLMAAEHEEWQTYVTQQFATFACSDPALKLSSEEEQQVYFAQHLYYKHMHDFLCEKTLQSQCFRHHVCNGGLLSFVSPATLPSQEQKHMAREELRKISALLREHREENASFLFLEAFDHALWAKWRRSEAMTTYLNAALGPVFRAFLVGEYFNTMQEVLAAMEKHSPRVMLPPFPVDVGGADADEQAIRNTLLSQATPTDHARAEALLEEE